jgi:hypothetical protein
VQEEDEEFLNDPEVVVVLKQQVIHHLSRLWNRFGRQQVTIQCQFSAHIFYLFTQIELTLMVLQVQECLQHVRSLNAKLASGVDPNSPELKVGHTLSFDKLAM